MKYGVIRSCQRHDFWWPDGFVPACPYCEAEFTATCNGGD